MKIIKEGNKKKNNPLLVKQITCGECECKFQLESEREAILVADQREGDYYKIRCPQCKTESTYNASLFQRSLVD